MVSANKSNKLKCDKIFAILININCVYNNNNNNRIMLAFSKSEGIANIDLYYIKSGNLLHSFGERIVYIVLGALLETLKNGISHNDFCCSSNDNMGP